MHLHALGQQVGAGLIIGLFDNRETKRARQPMDDFPAIRVVNADVYVLVLSFRFSGGGGPYRRNRL